MKYYYEFWFEIKGIAGRNYKREYTSSKILTVAIVKQNENRYKEIRQHLCQEIGLNERSFEDVELFDVKSIGVWKTF